MQCLSEGSYGKVYKYKLWGVLCTIKKLDVYNKFYIKELNILASLSYHNIIKYVFVINFKNNKSR